MTDLTAICPSCLNPKLVFVFGSNERGIHGMGAAQHANKFHDAQYGIPFGHTGDKIGAGSFAIPTKGPDVKTALPLDAIEGYVKAFLRYARFRPELRFAVTRIGCGLAGYTGADIGPLFIGAPANCILPISWRAETAAKFYLDSDSII